MTVSVAGQLIHDANALSALGRLALAFVDGGTEWLAWALADRSIRYEFADETQLIGQVQQGLHASRFALLPHLELKVSPLKLMTLSRQDLQTLARAESGDDSELTQAQVAKILQDHQLVTRSGLAAGAAFLSSVGVAASPLFQAMDFDDTLALYQLACQPTPGDDAAPALQQEAAHFSVRHARLPQDFCHYYRFYLDQAASRPSASADERAACATQAMNTLLPLLFGTLDCPQIDVLPSPAEVGLAVSNWLTRGRQIGFARLSLGLQQILQHTPYQGENGDAARSMVRQYSQAAQAFLAAGRPMQGRLGQDGATCLFEIAAGNLRAELQVGSNGVISLRDFGPQSKPPLAAISNEESIQ